MVELNIDIELIDDCGEVLCSVMLREKMIMRIGGLDAIPQVVKEVQKVLGLSK
jgi:hypothetical protein